MAKPTVSLIATTGARLKYALGGAPFKFLTAGVLSAALIGTGVWQAPNIWSAFLDVTGLQSEEVVQEREAAAAARAQLEESVKGLDTVVLIDNPSDDVSDAWDLLQTVRSNAETALAKDDVSSKVLEQNNVAIDRAVDAYDEAVAAQRKAEDEAAEKAKKKKEAAEKKAAAKAKKEAAEKKAAEEAAAAEAAAERARQEQSQETPSSPSGPSNSGPPGGGPSDSGSTAAVASQSLTVTCTAPSTVTVTATGGGTVTISGGGKSASGSGSASITVEVGSSATFSGTGQGSVMVSSSAC